MSAIILPVLYPIVTPVIAYYTLKYAAGIAVDIVLDKTKKAAWYIIMYPFSTQRKNPEEYVECKCVTVPSLGCKQEKNHEKFSISLMRIKRSKLIKVFKS